MSCSHRKREPICEWVWPRKEVRGRVNAVEQDTYEVYHCPSCGAVALYHWNQFCHQSMPLTGRLSYSFERRGKP